MPGESKVMYKGELLGITIVAARSGVTVANLRLVMKKHGITAE